MCEMQSVGYFLANSHQCSLFAPMAILWAMEKYCARRCKSFAGGVQMCKSVQVCKSDASGVPPGAQVRAILSARLGPFECTGPLQAQRRPISVQFSLPGDNLISNMPPPPSLPLNVFLFCNTFPWAGMGETEQIIFNSMDNLFIERPPRVVCVALQILVWQHISLHWGFKSAQCSRFANLGNTHQ